MKGYVFVSEEGRATAADFNYWVGLSLAFNDKAKASKTTDTEPVTSEALDKLVVGGLPDVGGFVIAASEVATPPPAPNPEAPSAPPSPIPSASVALPVPSAVPPPAKPDAGCGACSSAPTENQLPWSGLIASLLVAVGIRRRKSVTPEKRT